MASKKRNMRQLSEVEAKRELRKLIIQNKKLSREVETLKEEVVALKGKGEKIIGAGKYRSAFRRRADTEEMFSKKTYFSYVWTHLRHTSFFNIYSRILSYMRKYAFVTTTLKIVSLLFVAVEAVILIVISTSAFVASLLFTLIMSQSLMLLSLFTRKKQNRRNLARLTNKNIYIFFPPKGKVFEGNSYFHYFVDECIKGRRDYAVIVSPYIFNSKGIFSEKSPYHSARLDKEKVLIVRKNYYFTLRKNVIDTSAASVTEIY